MYIKPRLLWIFISVFAAMASSMCSNESAWTNLTSSMDNKRLPDSVLICTFVSSSLSIIGAIVIFVTYCTIPEAKNQTRRLLIYLTIADLLTSSGNLLGAIRYSYTHRNQGLITEEHIIWHCHHPDDICAAQSLINTFSALASFSWTIIIGLHILLALVYQSEWCFTTMPKVLAHSVSWGIPLVITLTAAFKNVLGEDLSIGSGPWCWIRGCLDQEKTILWMTVSGKGWEILTYIVTAFLYIYLKYYMIRKRRREGQPNLRYSQISYRLRDDDENYVLLWFVLYILRIWGTARYVIFVYKASTGQTSVLDFDQTDMVLMHFQSVGDSSQAFFNCLLFCVMDTTVRRGLITRIFCQQNQLQGRQLNEYNQI
ncbi:G-protein coupled receptor 157-like [Ostrea edulis]|nr:G-protein coupled receptor 157-like [Ostrea edulis]